MRFKYYLKGLGMGIIVTTIIMAVSCMIHNNNLSDQEIIKKAMELGMIMPESQDDSKNDLFGNHEKESQVTESTSKVETEFSSESEVTSEPSESVTEIPSETDSETPPQHIEVTQYVLHIVVGDFPRKIANDLYDNGMIDDANACMKYLGDYCEQNKKSIQVGSYTITKGMSYEEIAKMITK